MADGERRLVSLSGICLLLLFISCVCVTQSYGEGPEYSLSLSEPLVNMPSISLVVRRTSSRDRKARAVPDTLTTQSANQTATQTPTSASGPDSVTHDDGGQTLPDSPNHSGPSHVSPTRAPTSPVMPTNSSVTHSNHVTSTTTTQTTTEATPAPTTTPLNPFKDANTVEDHHTYYTSRAMNGEVNSFYTDIGKAKKHDTLSKSHRVATVIPLKFPFNFYGHPIVNVTVATGGFIYMSPFLHQWLTATQYIAPLMANFDPSLSSESNIYYLSQNDMFTVEWSKVTLQDQSKFGNFTFQTSLYKNGSISFVYKNIPAGIKSISDKNHPVKIGLSDAYYVDSYYPHSRIRKRTIYEYHQVTLQEELVRTGSVIFINPVKTCNMLDDCESCTRHTDVDFDCKWCNIIGRCSDGMDWYYQHWEANGCKKQGGDCSHGSDTPVAVIVVVILLVLGLVCGVAGWTFYAYTHPTSRSGMWLMEHRPSQIKAKIKFWKNNGSSDSAAKYKTDTEA